MRRSFSAPQWSAWFDEFSRSGLTVSEFCRNKGVSQNSFYVWKRKLAPNLDGESNANDFVPVAIAKDDRVEIEIPGGAILRVKNDPLSLEPVLAALQSLAERTP